MGLEGRGLPSSQCTYIARGGGLETWLSRYTPGSSPSTTLPLNIPYTSPYILSYTTEDLGRNSTCLDFPRCKKFLAFGSDEVDQLLGCTNSIWPQAKFPWLRRFTLIAKPLDSKKLGSLGSELLIISYCLLWRMLKRSSLGLNSKPGSGSPVASKCASACFR